MSWFQASKEQLNCIRTRLDCAIQRYAKLNNLVQALKILNGHLDWSSRYHRSVVSNGFLAAEDGPVVYSFGFRCYLSYLFFSDRAVFVRWTCNPVSNQILKDSSFFLMSLVCGALGISRNLDSRVRNFYPGQKTPKWSSHVAATWRFQSLEKLFCSVNWRSLRGISCSLYFATVCFWNDVSFLNETLTSWSLQAVSEVFSHCDSHWHFVWGMSC